MSTPQKQDASRYYPIYIFFLGLYCITRDGLLVTVFGLWYILKYGIPAALVAAYAATGLMSVVVIARWFKDEPLESFDFYSIYAFIAVTCSALVVLLVIAAHKRGEVEILSRSIKV